MVRCCLCTNDMGDRMDGHEHTGVDAHCRGPCHAMGFKLTKGLKTAKGNTANDVTCHVEAMEASQHDRL